MRDLRLVGLSDDGTRLVLGQPDGERYALPVDERVRAALRGDRSRLGQLQMEMESKLRPRDIQARIRAGQTLEEVAAEAGISLDRVQRYAGPILHEREHIAQQAASVGVRRDDHGAVQLLGELVSERLEHRGVPRDDLAWDAWRLEDGRWELRLDYHVGDQARSALWVYDPQRKTVVADDDEARWLLEEEPAATVTQLRPVPLPTAGAELTPARENGERGRDGVDSPAPLPPIPDDVAEVIGLTEAVRAESASAREPSAEPRQAADAAPAARRPAARKRASVPSWDEILFGSKKPE